MERIYKRYVKYLGAGLFALLALFSGGCKSTKIPFITGIGSISKMALKDSVEKKELDFETLYLNKVTINVVMPGRDQTLKGNFRIKKDSLFFGSFTAALGMEVFRFIVSDDSVRFVDRLNKKYFIGGVDGLKKRFKVDLGRPELEQLLGYQPFLYGRDLLDEGWSNSHLKVVEEGYRVIFNNIKDGEFNWFRHATGELVTSQELLFDSSFRLKQSVFHDPTKELKVLVDYEDLKKFQGKYYPQNIRIFVESKQERFLLQMKIHKLYFDKSLRFPFSVSSKYERINE